MGESILTSIEDAVVKLMVTVALSSQASVQEVKALGNCLARQVLADINSYEKIVIGYSSPYPRHGLTSSSNVMLNVKTVLD